MSSSSSSSSHHHTCCNRQKVKRGLWSPEEDQKLINYVSTYGHGCWSTIPKLAGLQRCGKSCRLRWINYLRPDVKRGNFTPQEAALIIELHRILGNRWSQIAKYLPGRTDNEVKNFWNSSIKKKLLAHARHCRSSDLYVNVAPKSSIPQMDQPFLIPNQSNIMSFDPPQVIDNNIFSTNSSSWYQPPQLLLNQNQNRNTNEEENSQGYDLDKEILEALLPELDSEKSMSMWYGEEEEEAAAAPWSMLQENEELFPGLYSASEINHPYHIDNITALMAGFASGDPMAEMD